MQNSLTSKSMGQGRYGMFRGENGPAYAKGTLLMDVDDYGFDDNGKLYFSENKRPDETFFPWQQNMLAAIHKLVHVRITSDQPKPLTGPLWVEASSQHNIRTLVYDTSDEPKFFTPVLTPELEAIREIINVDFVKVSADGKFISLYDWQRNSWTSMSAEEYVARLRKMKVVK